jgi:hypothetical protein
MESPCSSLQILDTGREKIVQSACQLLVNDVTVHVGTSLYFSDYPTNQDLNHHRARLPRICEWTFRGSVSE